MAVRKLTKNADTLLGTSTNDRFNAPLFTTALGTQTSTLQTGDVLNGGGGQDRLSGEVLAQFGSYFARPQLRSIETVNISALDGGGLGGNNEVVLDLARARKVERVISDDSNTNMQIRNAKATNDFALKDFTGNFGGLEVSGITASTAKVAVRDTESAYVFVDRKGSSAFTEFDAFVINSKYGLDVSTRILDLKSAGNIEENSVFLFNENYEEINVDADNDLELSADAIRAKQLNVKGDSAVSISTSTDLILSAGFDASANTAGVSVTSISGSLANLLGSQGDDSFFSVRSSSGLNVNLGGGDDYIRLDEAIDMVSTGGVDKFEGGAGSDTLEARIASGLTAAQGANITGIEALTLLDNSGGIFDLKGLPDVKTFNIEGFSDVLNFANVASGTTFNDLGEFSSLTISAPVGPDLASVNIGVGIDEAGSFAGDTSSGSVYTINRFNTINLESKGGDTVDPGSASDVNIVNIAASNTEILKISGEEDISITSLTNAFTTVDGSAASGNIDMTGVAIGVVATKITGGSGNDFLVGGVAADTFDLSKGGIDRVLFNDQLDSELAINQSDTINGFDAAGNDTLVFENAAGAVFTTAVTGVRSVADANGAGAELVFVGNAKNFIEAGAAIGAAGVGAEDFAAVFDSSTNTLYIDSNNNGALGAGDVQIIVNDANDALSKADFQLI